MKTKRQIAAGAACALALAGAAFAPAQAQAQAQAPAQAAAPAQGQPRQYVQALTVHARPDTALDFEAYARQVMAAAEKIGLKQRILVYQVTGGGPAYTYMVLSYFDKWAESDEMPSTQQILARALGEEEGAKVLAAGRRSIASAEQSVFKLVPELCVKPRAFDVPAPFMQIYRAELEPGKAREWERVQKRFKAILEQSPDTPTVIRRVAVEGPGATYVTSVPYATGAERDAFPEAAELLKKALGEDEYRQADQQRVAAIVRSEAYILRFRPDLSRVPK